MGYHPWPVTMTSSEIKKGLKNGEVAVAAGLLVGRPDKETVAYSDSIIREYNVVLTRAADGVSEISSLDDLQNKRIGARVGFVYPLLEERSGIELIRQRKDGENIRDLFLNELDFVVVGSVSDIYEFRSEGVMSDLQLLPAAVGYVDLGSAFSTATFSLEEIDEFRNRFNQMLGSPEWEAILFRNGIQDLVKEWPIVSQ
jgi:ABC-type amino acid transport substrate-binding protein